MLRFKTEGDPRIFSKLSDNPVFCYSIGLVIDLNGRMDGRYLQLIFGTIFAFEENGCFVFVVAYDQRAYLVKEYGLMWNKRSRDHLFARLLEAQAGKPLRPGLPRSGAAEAMEWAKRELSTRRHAKMIHLTSGGEEHAHVPDFGTAGPSMPCWTVTTGCTECARRWDHDVALFKGELCSLIHGIFPIFNTTTKHELPPRLPFRR
jgi:hypothetical protein